MENRLEELNERDLQLHIDNLAEIEIAKKRKSLSKKIIEIGEDVEKVEDSQLVKIDEVHFVREYLPLFYYDPNNILRSVWHDLSTNLCKEVLVVKDGKVTFRIPAFMPTVVYDDIKDVPLGTMSSNLLLDIENGNTVYIEPSIDELVETIDKHVKHKSNEERWNDFYKYFDSFMIFTDGSGKEIKKKQNETSGIDF